MKQIFITLCLLLFTTQVHAENPFLDYWNSAQKNVSETLKILNELAQKEMKQAPAPVSEAVSKPTDCNESNLTTSSALAPAQTTEKKPKAIVPSSSPDPLAFTCRRISYGTDSILVDIFFMSELNKLNEETRAACVNWAIDNGAPIDGNEGGLHPLILAISHGESNLAKILINRGANPNIRDDNGISALTNAAYSMLDDVVDLLLEKNADPNQGDENHAVPLISAVSKVDLRAVRSLLEHNADPNKIFIYGSIEKQAPLDNSAVNLIIIQGYLDDQKSKNKVFSELNINRYLKDHSPMTPSGRSEPTRTLEELMSDAKEIDALLRNFKATCATNPCGGTIGAGAENEKRWKNPTDQ